jgi:PAS domain S-box-containing protein
MEQMHSLLKRQLRRCFGDQFRIPEEWQGFVDAVNDAYRESDMDRGMLERSLELSSQELLQANSEVRAIFLAIPDLLFRLDSEGRILNYKAGVTSDLLLDPQELLGKRIQDIPLKQVGEKFSEAIKHVHESKSIVNVEYPLSIQGQTLYFEARLVPIPEDQIVVIIRNITERKLTEEKIRESEERFQMLFENVFDGICMYDEDPDLSKRRLVACNEQYAAMAGRTRDELLSLGVTQSLQIPLEESSNISRLESLSAKTAYQGSFSWIRPDRKDNIIEYVRVPIKWRGKSYTIGIDRDITERKLADKALQESIERYKNLTEISPVGIFHTDEKGVTTYVNPKWCQISGLSFEQGLGDGWLSAVYLDDREKLFKGWQEATNLHKASYSDYRFVRPDGTIAWVRGQAIPETNSENRIIGYIGTITDITELKQAEETLQRERNLFRMLIDNLPDAIYVKDSECRKTIANVADVRNMGRQSEAEVLGKTDFDLYPADIASGFYTDDLSVIQTGKGVLNKEEFFYDQEGKKNWLLTFKLPMRDKQGKIVGLVGIGREITEQKRVMETLTLLSHTVKSIGESISITDLHNNLLFVNEAFLKTYGYTEKEIIGKSINIVSCDPNTHEQTILAETVKGGWQGELLNKKKDGTLFPIFLSTSIVYDEKGQPTGLVGVATDITERKQAEEALRESQALYHSFIEHLPAGVFRKDSEDRYVFANTLFCQIKGIEMDEILGKTPIELAAHASEMKTLRPTSFAIAQDVRADEAIAHHEQIMRTGKPIEVEEVYPQRDGTTKYFQVVKSPVFASDGKIIGTQGVMFDITERRLAEEALRERDEQLRNIVEHSTNLFYSRNADQVFTYISPQAREIFDCEPGEAMVPITDFMSDNPINKLGLELAKKAVQVGARQEAYELELISRKGRRVWVEIQEAPVVKNEKTVSIVGAITDITERRWAEMALQVSEKKYRDIVTWAPIGIFQSTLSGKLLSGNSSIAELLGYDSVNDLIGCTMGQDIYYDEQDWKRFVENNESSERRLSISHEARWKTKNGSIIWVLITIHDVRDKSSEILYYEGFVFDITERKHAEEALRESEERYRLLVENSTDMVTEISAENTYLYISPNVKSILDYEPMELVGTNVLAKVYGKDKDAIGEILSKLGGSATYRYRDRLGNWHWFESSGRVYYTSSGEQRMVMVSRDITQRRKAEQQLEVSRKQLQHFTEHLEHILEEERKRISRELHDELGQLLTILKFDLSWLKLEGANSNTDIIVRVDAMMASVNEALASVKRISKEIRPPQLDALGLVGAIQWDIDQVEKKTGLKGIVTVDPAEIEIKSQVKTILYQVFREALTNTLRHAQAEHLFISLSHRLGFVILTIRDDGRGITKKELKGTTSLGLVGIRERVRMVGGTFSIEGKSGAGTVLTVEVPMKKKKNGESES